MHYNCCDNNKIIIIPIIRAHKIDPDAFFFLDTTKSLFHRHLSYLGVFERLLAR